MEKSSLSHKDTDRAVDWHHTPILLRLYAIVDEISFQCKIVKMLDK